MKYILKNSKTGKYIQSDKSSGWYPYDVDLVDARVWKLKIEAIDYAKMFKNEEFELHKLIIDSKHIKDLF